MTNSTQVRPIHALRGSHALRGTFNHTATTGELLQRIPLACYRHHNAPRLWDILKRGQALTLERERLNPHDPKAVAVRWLDHQLGYLPRTSNQLAAELLDHDEPLIARILEKRDHADRHHRLELAVYRTRQ